MAEFRIRSWTSPKSTGQDSQKPQSIRELTSDDKLRLDRQRRVVEQQFAGHLIRDWQSVDVKLEALQQLVDEHAFQPAQTYELQCLGIVFGDAFVRATGMEWVTVEDEYGSDPALRVRGTTIIIFPMTMISKRIERGEEIDVAGLFNVVLKHIEELRP
jgi:hypothetical protein